jgi:hypothetical protein
MDHIPLRAHLQQKPTYATRNQLAYWTRNTFPKQNSFINVFYTTMFTRNLSTAIALDWFPNFDKLHANAIDVLGLCARLALADVSLSPSAEKD